MKLKGELIQINPEQTFSSGFTKRTAVIKTDEQYPQTIEVEFLQNNTDLLDNYKVGMIVEISINLRGREWTNPQGETKFFNTIVGWRIENLTAPQGITPQEAFEPAQTLTEQEKYNEQNKAPFDDDDGLPF